MIYVICVNNYIHIIIKPSKKYSYNNLVGLQESALLNIVEYNKGSDT